MGSTPFTYNNAEIIKPLGKGAFGSCHLVMIKNQGPKKQPYVMKEIKSVDKKQLKVVTKEINLLKKMNHKNVIKYYGCDTITSYEGKIKQIKTYIFMELANNGDLS